MGILTLILLLALQGLLIGGLARLALPGRDPLSLPMTMAVGLAGSFVGGLLVRAAGGEGAAPFLVALVVSVGIVYLIRRRRGGGLTAPSAAEPRRPGPYER